MTTIICLVLKNSIFLASDSQLSSDNFRYPENFQKILEVSPNLLIACAGSVGYLQKNVFESVKSLQVQKILSNCRDFNISLSELSKELSDRNFYYPLEYKQFQSSSFILCGYEDGKLCAMSVGIDGSEIPITKYFSDGSGSINAMSVLEQGYSPDLSLEEASALVYNSLRTAHKFDVYTNDDFQIYSFSEINGKIVLKEWKIPQFDISQNLDYTNKTSEKTQKSK